MSNRLLFSHHQTGWRVFVLKDGTQGPDGPFVLRSVHSSELYCQAELLMLFDNVMIEHKYRDVRSMAVLGAYSLDPRVTADQYQKYLRNRPSERERFNRALQRVEDGSFAQFAEVFPAQPPAESPAAGSHITANQPEPKKLILPGHYDYKPSWN